ncbi:MAG: hypothetical protein ACYCS7_00280 [Acidimicrobiales bacterium]
MTAESVDIGGTRRRVSRRRVSRVPADLIAAAAGRFQRADLRNTWQVAAGSVLVPLGVVVILIAWYGSAHTPYVQQQIPYLVSGSFVGLGMMVVGGLLYWAHWLYRIYDQADLHHVERLQRDQQLFELMETVLASREGPVPVAPALAPSRRSGRKAGPVSSPVLGTNGSAPGAGVALEASLVATASGSNVHRADCPIMARHPAGARRLSAAEAHGRPLCQICQPVVSA